MSCAHGYGCFSNLRVHVNVYLSCMILCDYARNVTLQCYGNSDCHDNI